MPTLWRNNVLLGRIVPLPQMSGDGSIRGFLEPAPGFAGVEPVTQLRIPEFDNRPTYQFVGKPVEVKLSDIEDEAGRLRPLKPIEPIEPIEMPPDLDPGESPPGAPNDFPPGASADQLLEIRSDEGGVLDFGYINLSCVAVPDKYREKMQRDLGLSGNSKEMWWVTASG